MKISRRGMLSSALLATATAGLSPVGARKSSEPDADGRDRPAAAARPNILIIVLDDVGFADLGCYGSEIATPAIDKLAAGGARFSNFHTAPLCSPTRASLLTGRNPHDVGAGVIADWANENPGYQGVVAPSVPMLPELFGRQGYGCYATGKWHLTSIRDQGTTGPFGQWPTRRGFDRWYGFSGANADQWHPELFEGTSAIDPPAEENYHLSTDIVDHMIGYLDDHVAGAPDRPFFSYVAFGACHWPQQVPKAYVDRLRGRYDAGWTRIRNARFERQKAIGLVPQDTKLPPENANVPAWESLPSAERQFAARCQEVYAAFLEHTDEQIGRLLDALDRMGVGDDTIVVLLSDNGATAEGTQAGLADVRGDLYIGAQSAEERLASLDLLGSADSFPAYPLGWAAASNTPLRWYKSSTHEGGIRAPLIVRYPRMHGGDGRPRPQFHHVSDIAPTLFELSGMPSAAFSGTSFAYALRAPEAATRKRVQLFESTGSRALWCDGWKAVARHDMGTSFDRDRWELYHLDSDFTEVTDRAAEQPARLAALQSLWLDLARSGQVLPLDDRRLERYQRNLPARRNHYKVFPGGSRLDRLSMPEVRSAHRMIATATLKPGDSGVIVAAGTTLRGYELFIQDGELQFVYLFSRAVAHRMRTGSLPRGECQFGVIMTDGQGPRVAQLIVDGVVRTSMAIPHSWPTYALGAGLRCGANRGAPISRAYSGDFPFTGKLDRVEFDILSSPSTTGKPA